ncbi:hypothetical protein [Arthrobacter sp. AL12]|uniref:hypothetical protein n=1 Tax=Arthrobacter sp. AL12 TaxID=3042241 RepID=UPI00249A4636|nr:hypothetical protein [Arthrobacter sp. AL12]MDI3211756.1 hypothetical protein [Arthrobacter sp. AL12]
MADKKISDLGLLAVADATDLVPLVDVSGSVTKKTTVGGLAAAVIANIPNASIPSSKLSLGAQSSKVVTGQATSSTSYTDLTTVGPAVTVTISANGMALVFLNATMFSAQTSMGFAISGATTVAADDVNCILINTVTSRLSGAFLVTGLNAGSTTFTAKYKVGSGTGTFVDRVISVIPL